MFKNHNGDWLLGFMTNLGRCDIISAELWAIYQALLFAWHNDWTYIMVESDSTITINLLSRTKTSSSSHLPLIATIKTLCSRNWQVKFAHTYRETNKIADLLSKTARENQDGVTMPYNPPEEILTLLETDRNGRLYARYSPT